MEGASEEGSAWFNSDADKQWDKDKWGDPVEFLGIDDKATTAEVERAYRRLLLKFHPGLLQFLEIPSFLGLLIFNDL